MRKIFAMLLALALLAGFACAADALQAHELAQLMSEYLPEMEDIKKMPLEGGEQNRAIWYDGREDLKCSLIVYQDADEAYLASLEQSTRDTAVRNVGACALYIHRDLGADIILDYQLALADILNVQMEDGEADYIMNESTRKFHRPDCETLKDMKDENRRDFTGDRDFLIDCGYEACKYCEP